MKRTIATVLVGVVVAAVGAAVLATASPSSAARAAELPGMCNGPRTHNLVVNAHANGHPNSVPKFILNVWTDSSGNPAGSMILGRGTGRLLVTDWCRVWQHDPNQQQGGNCGEPYPPGAITAHAVGLVRADGSTIIVRADVRKYADGSKVFRVRYRTWTAGEGDESNEADGCEDEGWTRVPAEGWDPLDQLNVRTTG